MKDDEFKLKIEEIEKDHPEWKVKYTITKVDNSWVSYWMKWLKATVWTMITLLWIYVVTYFLFPNTKELFTLYIAIIALLYVFYYREVNK